jgi:hypothetical protein
MKTDKERRVIVIIEMPAPMGIVILSSGRPTSSRSIATAEPIIAIAAGTRTQAAAAETRNPTRDPSMVFRPI